MACKNGKCGIKKKHKHVKFANPPAQQAAPPPQPRPDAPVIPPALQAGMQQYQTNNPNISVQGTPNLAGNVSVNGQPITPQERQQIIDQQAQILANAQAQRPAAQQSAPAQAPVLPQQLRAGITPATVNPATVTPATINPANITATPVNGPNGAPQPTLAFPPAPLRNNEKNNYKSDPYKRGKHAGAHVAMDTLNGVVQGGTQGGAPGAIAGGLTGAILSAIGEGKNWSINNKVKYHVKKLNDYLHDKDKHGKLIGPPRIPNDPRLQQLVKYHQQRMNELTPGMLAPGQEIGTTAAEQHAFINKGVNAANQRGSEANYAGKGAPPGYFGEDVNAINNGGANAVEQGGGGQGGGGGPGGQNPYGQTIQLPNYTQEQMGLQNELIGRILENRADFEPIAEDEIRRFKEETAPQLAEQYFGRNPNSFSGAYPEALGRAGSNLGQRLAAMQSQYEAQKEQGYLQGALQPAFGNLYINPGEQRPRPFFQTPQGQQGNSFQGLLERATPGLVNGAGALAANWWNNRQQNQVANKNEPTYSQGTPTPITSGFQPTRTTEGIYRNQEQLSNLNPQAFAKNDPLQQLLMQSAEARTNRLGGRTR